MLPMKNLRQETQKLKHPQKSQTLPIQHQKLRKMLLLKKPIKKLKMRKIYLKKFLVMKKKLLTLKLIKLQVKLLPLLMLKQLKKKMKCCKTSQQSPNVHHTTLKLKVV
jgi:hypothetical protein